jgi:hypothetical protein
VTAVTIQNEKPMSSNDTVVGMKVEVMKPLQWQFISGPTVIA